jgi:hypothetical protein
MLGTESAARLHGCTAQVTPRFTLLMSKLQALIDSVSSIIFPLRVIESAARAGEWQ